jgi:hypothetical protein
VIFIEKDDSIVKPLGAKGLGEIGIVGVGKQLWACDLEPLLREFQHPSAHMVRSAPGRQVNARSSEFARSRQNVFSAS